MAKYTELLGEYLNDGGTLPSIFEEIEGFTDLFIKHFIDKEIGFETETLFTLKLEEYAEINIPIYKERLEWLVTAKTNAKNPIKVKYQTSNTTINGGARKNKTTELPFDSETAQPNIITEGEATVDQNATINQLEDKGVTVDEAFKIIDELNKEIKPLILKLLNEFKPCFMGVY